MAEHVFQEFVQELQCPLCHQLYRDPHLSINCGHVFCKDCVVSCLEGPGIIESRCPFPGSPKPCGLPLPRKDLRPHHKIQALVQHIHALCKQGVLPSSLLPPSQPAPPDNTAAPAHHTDASPKADSSDESTNPGLSDIARQVARNLPTSPCALRAVSSQLQAGLARCESLLASRATPAAQLVPESLPVHEMYHLDSLDDALRQRGYLLSPIAGTASHSTQDRPSAVLTSATHTAPSAAPRKLPTSAASGCTAAPASAPTGGRGASRARRKRGLNSGTPLAEQTPSPGAEQGGQPSQRESGGRRRRAAAVRPPSAQEMVGRSIMLCDSGEVARIVSHHRSKGSLLELPNGKQRWANLNKVVWVPVDDRVGEEGKENVGAGRAPKRPLEQGTRGAAKRA